MSLPLHQFAGITTGKNGIESLRKIHDSVYKISELVVRHVKQDKGRQTLIDGLDNIMIDYCAMANGYTVAMKLLQEETARPIDEDIGWETPEEFNEILEKKTAEFDPNSSNIFVTYKKKLQAKIDIADDEEVVMTNDHVVTIDPIGLLRMVDPVKSKVCGHQYERSTILGIMKGDKGTRCPYASCLYKKHIRVDDLEDDPTFKAYLLATLDR